MKTPRRHFLAVPAALLLAGCGFQLRRTPDFVFDSVTLRSPSHSPLAAELRRNLLASGQVAVVSSGLAPAAPDRPASAPVLNRRAVSLDLLLEQREKVVVGLNATGQVREFQLRTRLRFRLRGPLGAELIPETELLQQRDMSFSEAAVLSKESEEAMLYRDMQADLVQQLLRRLAAVRTL